MQGETALLRAARRPELVILELLLSDGAEVNSKTEDVSQPATIHYDAAARFKVN